ncbi:MAG: cell division protein FtsB [Rhodanobacteraceae bacterium]
MLRVIFALLFVLLLILQYTLWLGDGGYRDVSWLRKQVAAQKAENKRLEERNKALAAEVEDLKQGKQAIEGRARSELGLIKPGETFYQVVTPAPAATRGSDEH